MSWLLNTFAAATAATDNQNNENESYDSSVNVYEVVQRMQSSSLYEDKMEAMSKLVDLSSQVPYQKDFAKNESFQILVQLLNTQRDDLDVTRQLLEIVLNLTHSEKFGEQYLSVLVNNGFVPTVLSLLEENDYYIKYHTTKLITLLLRHNIQLVQQNILAEASVSKLVSTLDESEDIIRNEGLLLMHTLTHSGSHEVKKIIAFEGAFEKLFKIIFEEGGNSGGIIVQDCLQIVHNLLFENESNQKYFMVINCVQYLYHLLLLRPASSSPVVDDDVDYSSLLTERKIVIMLKTLEIVHDLIKEGKKNDDARLIICKTGIINNIIVLALGELPHNEASTVALFVLGLLTFQFRPAQEALESFNFDRPRSDVLETAIVRLLRIVLYDGDELRRQIANDCLRKFLYNNKEGQLFIASTVKAPTLITSSAEEGMLCGITLANAVLSYDKPKQHLAESFHGASVLSYIIRQNNKCKDVLLEIPYEVNKGKRPVSFFECFVKATIQATRSRAHETLSLGLLQVLCYWLRGSSGAARRFMHNTSNLLFFIELVTGRSIDSATVHTQGLGSLILGLLCIEFEDDADDSLGGYTKEGLVDTVSKRVGLDRFNALWNSLSSTNEFNIAMHNNHSPQFFETLPTQPVHFNVYDYAFATLAKDIHDDMVNFFSNPEKYVSSSPSIRRESASMMGTDENQLSSKVGLVQQPMVDESVVQKLNELIQQKELDLNQAREESAQLRTTIEENKKMIDSLTDQLQQSQKELERLKQDQSKLSNKEQTYEEEIKNLQLRIEQADQEVKNHQAELAVRETMSEQNIRALNLQLQSKEHELENLSGAYEQLQQFMEEKERDIVKYQKKFKEEESKCKQMTNERDSLLAQTEALNQKASSVQKLEEEIANKQQQEEQLREQHQQQLSNRDSEITSLRSQLEELKAQNHSLIQQQQLQEAMNKNQESSVSAELEQVQALLQSRDNSLAQLQEQLNTQNQQLQQLKSEMEQKDKKIEELEQDNDDMMDIVEQLETKLAALQTTEDAEATAE